MRNAEGHTSHIVYNRALGVPTAARDANGLTTKSRIDTFGQALEVIAPDGVTTKVTRSRVKTNRWMTRMKHVTPGHGESEDVADSFGRDYHAPLYKQLFGGQSPSELKRPLLGAQLATMRHWVGPLGAAGIPELSQIATRLAAAILKADEAEKQISLAQHAVDVFNAGSRTTFINECNAARKLTFGKLGELAHHHSELPNDFSDRFFKSNGGSRTPTTVELTQSIARTRAKLERQEAQLAAMKEKAALQEKTRLEAELAERKAKLDTAQKRAAEAAAEVAKLEAELAEGSSG